MCTHFNMLRFKTFKGAMLFETRPFKEGGLGFFWQTFCHLKNAIEACNTIFYSQSLYFDYLMNYFNYILILF